MKRLLKKAIGNLGYDVIPYDATRHQLEKNEHRWLQSMNIKTVLDVGSSNGGFARKIRRVLPSARVISFEALKPSYEALNERMKADNNFESHLVALSNFNGKTVFRMSSNVGSSSLLPMADLHKAAYPMSKNITELEVECKRLDDMNIELNKNVLLKPDVQGAEKLVLEGAENVLKQTELIFSEVNFQELYEGCVLFNDLVAFLQQRGFQVIGIENVSQDPANGMFLQADAWFQRR